MEQKDPELFPEAPRITAEMLAECRKNDNYCPVLFEWYKFTGLVCNFFASIQRQSAALRPIPAHHYHVLVGLLNRCCRLMLSNVALSHEGLYGETTAIVDRCIFESAVKLVWLCEAPMHDRFERFTAEGLKTELEFREKINTNITARGGEVLPIETRLLTSIENHIRSSGLTAEQIAATKKCPDLASMIDGLGHDRLLYLIGQKIGSHHVHGTWPSLRLHYLEENETGDLRPRDHDCETHVNQYVFIPKIVLSAVEAFVRAIVADAVGQKVFLDVLESVHDEIDAINAEVVGNDFSRASDI
jgi:hypothetical protein